MARWTAAPTAEELAERARVIPVSAPRRLLRLVQLNLVGEYVGQLVHGLLHPHLLQSGATRAEALCPLPGDDLVPRPTWEATRAITIDGTPADIWPWLRQMGYGRAGWYGWFPLHGDPVYGVATRSADEIVPQLQHLAEGDVLLDGPGCDETKGAWKVQVIEPEHAIVLYSLRELPSGREIDPHGPRPGTYLECSWAFVLIPIDGMRTRLLKRTRVKLGLSGWVARAVIPIYVGGDTVMQRTILEGIKTRVETARQDGRS